MNGIEVYNRANPMTDVIIRNNKVTQDPNSKLENDDDDPAPLPWLHSYLDPNK